jgi:hypothetical protein
MIILGGFKKVWVDFRGFKAIFLNGKGLGSQKEYSSEVRNNGKKKENASMLLERIPYICCTIACARRPLAIERAKGNNSRHPMVACNPDNNRTGMDR